MQGAISAVAYDKDGKTLVTGSYDGSLKIWSHEGHCLDEFIGVTDSVSSIAYIPETKCLWVTGRENMPSIIDTLAPADVTEWVADTCGMRNLPLTKVYHAPDSEVAIGVCEGIEIIIWRFNRFGPHRVLQGHADWVECLVICYRKPPKIAEDDDDQTGKKRGAVPKRVTFNAGEQLDSGPNSLASSPEPETPVKQPTRPRPPSVQQPGSLLDTEVYSAGADGSILKWKPSPGNNCDSWVMHEYSPPTGSAILCMIHDPTLDVIITGSEDCKIRVWNLDTQPTMPRGQAAGQEISGPDVLRGHEAKIVGLCVHNEEYLISASYDKTLRWWNLPFRVPLDGVENAHELPIQDMQYSPQRGELATCGGGNFMKIWNASKRRHLATFTGGTGNIIMIKWCNLDNGFWITATDEGEITMWDPETGTMTRSMCQKREPVTCLFVDEINRLVLMSMLSDHLIRGFDMNMEKELCAYVGHTDQIHSLVHFPHRNQYLSGSWDNTIRAWLIPDSRAEPKPAAVLRTAKDEEGVDPLQEEPLVSSYEKEYPLVPPKTLQNAVPAMFPSNKRPDSRETVAPAPASVTSRSSSSSHSSSQAGSHLNLSRRLQDLDRVLKPRSSLK